MRKAKRGSKVRCAVIGYSMGQTHANYIRQTEGLELVAVCDLDAGRRQLAREEHPGIKTYSSVAQLLGKGDFDLASVVTPHSTHAPIALQLLKAKKHVVLDKPMCLTVKEADAMISAAKKSRVMLSVFHNRRWDGDFMTLLDIIKRGLIGEVFHVEAWGGGYGHPGKTWRADKKISGGALYDWGAHYVDWILHVVPRKMVSITGFFHKRVWMDATNEDHVEAIVRFQGGEVANVQLSNIARAGKPRWHILGTKGAIVDQGGSFRVYTEVGGLPAELDVKYQKSRWEAYYPTVADHLLRGKPLAVTPESARRAIQIMEFAGRSAKAGKPIPVQYP